MLQRTVTRSCDLYRPRFGIYNYSYPEGMARYHKPQVKDKLQEQEAVSHQIDAKCFMAR